MDLTPREVSFVKEEMKNVQQDETRQPTERTEASSIREKANRELTE